MQCNAEGSALDLFFRVSCSLPRLHAPPGGPPVRQPAFALAAVPPVWGRAPRTLTEPSGFAGRDDLDGPSVSVP